MAASGGESGEVVMWDGADGGEEGFAHCVVVVCRERAWLLDVYDDVLPFWAVFEVAICSCWLVNTSLRGRSTGYEA